MTPAPRKSAVSPQSQLFSTQQEPGIRNPDTRNPEGCWITAYTDGGSRGNPGPAGYGVLLQREDGAMVAELSEFLGIHSNNVAEYSALLGALEYALAHGHSHLRVISDSELMVKQIRGQYSVKSPDLRPLYEEARRRIARLQGFEIQHVLRGKNKKADQLANDAMDRGMRRTPAGTSQALAGSVRIPAASSANSITSPNLSRTTLTNARPPVHSQQPSAPASRPEPSATPTRAKPSATAVGAAATAAPSLPDYANIPISRPAIRSATSPYPDPIAKPAPGPIRGIVRHGAIQLPEDALPEGTVVIVMTEEALRGRG